MKKTKIILVDIALFTILIMNLLKPNVYIGYLISLISALTIIAHSLAILCIFSILTKNTNAEKKAKKKLKDYLKNRGKVFKLYQYITNIVLTILLALNGLIVTAVIFALSITVLNAFKKKLTENDE